MHVESNEILRAHGEREANASGFSRKAAKACSPRHKPWVKSSKMRKPQRGERNCRRPVTSPPQNQPSFNNFPRNEQLRFFPMPQDPLQIIDEPGPSEGHRTLHLNGPITLNNLFQFQTTVRADHSRLLILDLTNVPYVDSAGIGALVGAYVTHEKDGRSLAMVGVNDRVRSALQVTRVEQFFRFYSTVAEVESAA
jgi:anti-sigma B factor antagonist